MTIISSHAGPISFLLLLLVCSEIFNPLTNQLFEL